MTFNQGPGAVLRECSQGSPPARVRFVGIEEADADMPLSTCQGGHVILPGIALGEICPMDHCLTRWLFLIGKVSCDDILGESAPSNLPVFCQELMLWCNHGFPSAFLLGSFTGGWCLPHFVGIVVSCPPVAVP